MAPTRRAPMLLGPPKVVFGVVWGMPLLILNLGFLCFLFGLGEIGHRDTVKVKGAVEPTFSSTGFFQAGAMISVGLVGNALKTFIRDPIADLVNSLGSSPRPIQGNDGHSLLSKISQVERAP